MPEVPPLVVEGTPKPYQSNPPDEKKQNPETLWRKKIEEVTQQFLQTSSTVRNVIQQVNTNSDHPQFTVEITFILNNPEGKGNDIDNLSKPVIDTLFYSPPPNNKWNKVLKPEQRKPYLLTRGVRIVALDECGKIVHLSEPEHQAGLVYFSHETHRASGVILVRKENHMLIMTDKQCKEAGIESLDQRCTYCSKVLYAYPLIMGDDPRHSVYHISCAVELATDILLDLSDFFCPPVPFDRVVILTTPPSESRA